jgi:hypothetical protein
VTWLDARLSACYTILRGAKRTIGESVVEASVKRTASARIGWTLCSRANTFSLVTCAQTLVEAHAGAKENLSEMTDREDRGQ